MITFKSRNIEGETKGWKFDSFKALKEIWNSDFPDLPANDDTIWDIIIDGKSVLENVQLDRIGTNEFWFEDIFAFENLEKKKIMKVEPIYTGGNIYIFYVRISENEYFMADSCEFDIALLDTDPWDAGYDLPFEYDWQQEHFIKCLDEKEAVLMFIDMLKWVLENEPRGNYSLGEMEDLLVYAKELNRILSRQKEDKMEEFLSVARELNNALGVTPLLYGSLGLEQVTDKDLSSDDIDILIPEIYLKKYWPVLISLMEVNDYGLHDQKEHSFIKDGAEVAFANIESLPSFAGVKYEDAKVIIGKGARYMLLDLPDFLKVYEASLKDGYRQKTKNKKDEEKIELIKELLS